MSKTRGSQRHHAIHSYIYLTEKSGIWRHVDGPTMQALLRNPVGLQPWAPCCSPAGPTAKYMNLLHASGSCSSGICPDTSLQGSACFAVAAGTVVSLCKAVWLQEVRSRTRWVTASRTQDTVPVSPIRDLLKDR